MSAVNPQMQALQTQSIAEQRQKVLDAPKPAEVMATWSISLDTKCPNCDHDFDLLDDLSSNDSGIEPIEHGTPRTNNYEATCPRCRIEFEVCFEY